MQAEARRTGREESEGGSGGCEARRKETTRRSSRAGGWKAGWMAMISGWPLPEAIQGPCVDSGADHFTIQPCS